MSAASGEKALLSKSAAARLLGVSVHTVDAMIREGQLETRQVAGLRRPRVTRHSIEVYLTRPQAQKTVEQLLREFRNS